MMYVSKLTAAMLLLLVPFTSWAQDDDMYFVPKKKDKKAKTEQKTQTPNRYQEVEIIYADDDDDISGISGSNRSVDEYNRRGGSSLGYRIGADTLYAMTDSTAITNRRMANDIYAQGYEEGYADGEDYAISRRMGRFSYGSIYASPWYYSYYDPFYYDYYDPWWGWGGYHVGYYGWHRPYWGYSWGYGPYWGYSWSWHRPYYGGYYGWGGYHHHGGSRPHHGGYAGSRRGGWDTRSQQRWGMNRPNYRSTPGSRSSSTTPSVRRGQSGPIGSRGSAASQRTTTASSNRTYSNSGNSSSSRSNSNYGGSSRSSSSSSGSFGGSSRGGGSSSGSFGGSSRGGGGGSSRGGGGGSGRGGRR